MLVDIFQGCNVQNMPISCKCANMLLVGYVAKDRKSQDSDLGKRRKNLYCLAQCCVVYMSYLIHTNVTI